MMDEIKPLPRIGTMWRNRRNGTIYVALGMAKNTTNGPSDGEPMVIYAEPGESPDNYVREVRQFYECFEAVTE